jgi:hypothetical protein
VKKMEGKIDAIHTTTKFRTNVGNYWIEFDVSYDKASPGWVDRSTIRIQAVDSWIPFDDFPKIIRIYQRAYKYAQQLKDQMPAVTLPDRKK